MRLCSLFVVVCSVVQLYYTTGGKGLLLLQVPLSIRYTNTSESSTAALYGTAVRIEHHNGYIDIRGCKGCCYRAFTACVTAVQKAAGVQPPTCIMLMHIAMICATWPTRHGHMATPPDRTRQPSMADVRGMLRGAPAQQAAVLYKRFGHVIL